MQEHVNAFYLYRLVKISRDLYIALKVMVQRYEYSHTPKTRYIFLTFHFINLKYPDISNYAQH